MLYACMLYAVCCMLYAEGCEEGGGEGGGVEDEVQTNIKPQLKCEVQHVCPFCFVLSGSVTEMVSLRVPYSS